ncbi:hypothetical protein RBH29_11935 [Herbivorax sp. ANBcel31]|nr:hypothetical protein [Herbivorax sp. ANBcel31]MDQ2087136.1 hypothetical protein [Herbivorax sp. ANBcel31]
MSNFILRSKKLIKYWNEEKDLISKGLDVPKSYYKVKKYVEASRMSVLYV